MATDIKYKRMSDETEFSILIFKPKIARQLLKLGHLIIDIKQHKSNKDKTVFVFKKTEDLMNNLEKIK